MGVAAKTATAKDWAMDKVRTIIGKEWAEVFRNRLVLFSVLFLPLIFIALPIITLVATNSLTEEQAEEASVNELTGSTGLPGFDELCAEMSEADCVQLYMLNLYTFMFMILPVAIPVTIAAYSIVGEKAAHSLEPLLATPITTMELLMGKGLAAVIPAVVATWLSYVIYVIAALIIAGPTIFAYAIQPIWLIAIFVVGPLMTILAVSAAIIISARVTDPRVAEQISMVVILPVILIILGQSVGLILVDQTMVLILGAVVLVADIVVGYLAIKAFQRETILTKWK